MRRLPIRPPRCTRPESLCRSQRTDVELGSLRLPQEVQDQDRQVRYSTLSLGFGALVRCPAISGSVPAAAPLATSAIVFGGGKAERIGKGSMTCPELMGRDRIQSPTVVKAIIRMSIGN